MLDFTKEITTALYPIDDTRPYPHLIKTDICHLPSYYDVSGLASASIAAAYAEALLFCEKTAPDSTLDFTLSQALASHWFGFVCAPPEGVVWDLPPIWDEIAGLYQTKTGWIRLHTNAPAHRAAALSVLKCAPTKEPPTKKDVAEAVALWDGTALETAIVKAGGCAAQMLEAAEWAAHPQGQAVAKDPLILWDNIGEAATSKKDSGTPIRVLDCTRILAGPVCTRFLGGLGMDVLRLDPPDWHEPSIEQEITRGKRCATLDLKTDSGRQKFLQLLSGADVFVHGLRRDALEDLGLGAAIRRAHNSTYIDVSLNAYGWRNKWQSRRGFDSLVQMSCGIAAFGMEKSGNHQPTPLPVQALDHATGYLMAASVLRALRMRRQTGKVLAARLSLARTAMLLCQTAKPEYTHPLCAAPDAQDYGETIKAAGLAMRHIGFPVRDDVLALEQHWQKRPPLGLHKSSPEWQ